LCVFKKGRGKGPGLLQEANMPIGGFVIHVWPAKKPQVLKELAREERLSVYAHDDKGHVVVVIETETSEEMAHLVRSLSLIEGIFTINLAYLYGEDEVEKIESGAYKPQTVFGKAFR